MSSTPLRAMACACTLSLEGTSPPGPAPGLPAGWGIIPASGVVDSHDRLVYSLPTQLIPAAFTYACVFLYGT
jgi:hypothetical protein